MVSWCPPRGVVVSTPWCRGVLPGLWLKIRLEMLSSVVSGGNDVNDGETTEMTREPPKNDQSLNACNFLNNGPIFNPKKVLESSWSPLPNDSRNDRETMETTGENDGNDGGNHGLVSCWILDWECYPPWCRGFLLFHLVSCLVCGLKLDCKCCPPWCRGFHPVVSTLSCLVNGSKLDWKYCPPWCRGFHPRGVVVSCLVDCLKLDWKFVSVVSPKWHHGMVSFFRWKPRTLTLKSCDHSFRPIRRLHSFKSHTSLEKLWDFMQKEFPFKEQSC